MPPWVLRVTTQLMSLRSLRRDKDAETEAAGGIWNMAASASPGDWRHWLRLSSPGQMGSEHRWQRYQHSPVWVTRPETTPGLQSPWKLSVATEVSTSELDSSEVKTWIGAWHEDVLPGAVPRHEVASWSGPEDVQHADVLPTVLRQIFWSVWWVSYLSWPFEGIEGRANAILFKMFLVFLYSRGLKFYWCKYDVDALWYCHKCDKGNVLNISWYIQLAYPSGERKQCSNEIFSPMFLLSCFPNILTSSQDFYFHVSIQIQFMRKDRKYSS